MDDKVKVVCLECAATNNYPKDAAGKKVLCGRCRNVLPVPGTVAELSEERLARIIRASGLPVLVDFFSPTCAPCHVMSPVIESLARRRTGELLVAKVNVDQNMRLASSLRIQGVPTFIIFHKGLERARMSGAVPETDFSLWVASRA